MICDALPYHPRNRSAAVNLLAAMQNPDTLGSHIFSMGTQCTPVKTIRAIACTALSTRPKYNTHSEVTTRDVSRRRKRPMEVLAKARLVKPTIFTIVFNLSINIRLGVGM
jgi:hypothetical protein